MGNACCESTGLEAKEDYETKVLSNGVGPKVYVVTGSSSGLGLELVKQLAARGEKVFATCRKRGSSATGVDEISKVPGDVTIIEGIDIAKDDVGAKLAASKLAGVKIDVLVHNAGGLNATRDLKGMAAVEDQKLENVSTARMVEAFELNTLGPLRVQQALNAQMVSPGGKVAIISTGMGSIGDNTSGGFYAYRTSKTMVNQVARSMAFDLKEKGIAVVAISPGLVVTEFGPGPEMMTKMGGMTATQSCTGLITVMDELSMENTGRFMHVPKDGSAPVEFPGGW